MRPTFWLRVAVLLLLAPPAAVAQGEPRGLPRAARGLAGTLVDHTHNHGADRRIWSPALGARRDLYVYLPPGFDPAKRYPALLWLHGIAQDERTFLDGGLRALDTAIACGRLPPLIVAIPDGTCMGRAHLLGPQTLWLNSNLGPYEDYLFRDVWNFVQAQYPVHPDRAAHVVGGFSAGAAAAYRVAIKYRAEFGVVFGISGPLNSRWVDCRGRYFAKFDPSCWGWRTDVSHGREAVGRLYGGAVKVRVRHLVYPLFGRGPEALQAVITNNPIEMLDRYAVRPGELAMFVASGGRDEYNLDAQAESFVYRARERGLAVAVVRDPQGRHNMREAQKFLPALVGWLGPRLGPYSSLPDGEGAPAENCACQPAISP